MSGAKIRMTVPRPVSSHEVAPTAQLASADPRMYADAAATGYFSIVYRTFGVYADAAALESVMSKVSGRRFSRHVISRTRPSA